MIEMMRCRWLSRAVLLCSMVVAGGFLPLHGVEKIRADLVTAYKTYQARPTVDNRDRLLTNYQKFESWYPERGRAAQMEQFLAKNGLGSVNYYADLRERQRRAPIEKEVKEAAQKAKATERKRRVAYEAKLWQEFENTEAELRTAVREAQGVANQASKDLQEVEQKNKLAIQNLERELKAAQDAQAEIGAHMLRANTVPQVNGFEQKWLQAQQQVVAFQARIATQAEESRVALQAASQEKLAAEAARLQADKDLKVVQGVVLTLQNANAELQKLSPEDREKRNIELENLRRDLEDKTKTAQEAQLELAKLKNELPKEIEKQRQVIEKELGEKLAAFTADERKRSQEALDKEKSRLQQILAVEEKAHVDLRKEINRLQGALTSATDQAKLDALEQQRAKLNEEIKKLHESLIKTSGALAMLKGVELVQQRKKALLQGSALSWPSKKEEMRSQYGDEPGNVAQWNNLLEAYSELYAAVVLNKDTKEFANKYFDAYEKIDQKEGASWKKKWQNLLVALQGEVKEIDKQAREDAERKLAESEIPEAPPLEEKKKSAAEAEAKGKASGIVLLESVVGNAAVLNKIDIGGKFNDPKDWTNLVNLVKFKFKVSKNKPETNDQRDELRAYVRSLHKGNLSEAEEKNLGKAIPKLETSVEKEERKAKAAREARARADELKAQQERERQAELQRQQEIEVQRQREVEAAAAKAQEDARLAEDKRKAELKRKQDEAAAKEAKQKEDERKAAADLKVQQDREAQAERERREREEKESAGKLKATLQSKGGALAVIGDKLDDTQIQTLVPAANQLQGTAAQDGTLWQNLLNTNAQLLDELLDALANKDVKSHASKNDLKSYLQVLINQIAPGNRKVALLGKLKKTF
jgi:hypothetical protein